MNETIKNIVSNEVVKDENGKRRFHGAFTGGFAAGYFNTVGSAEGWKPSEFKSSKNNRAKVIKKTAEDYMDEDDDPLLNSKIQTKKEFHTLDNINKFNDDDNNIIPSALLADLLIPSTNPIGKELLKTMGWKEGQGIGPRLTAEEKGYNDEESKKHTFARDNIHLDPIKIKNDRYGVGYVPLLRNQIQQKKITPKVMKMSDIFTNNSVAASFGISALEENDDMDIYGDNNTDNYDKVLIDDNDDNDKHIHKKSKKNDEKYGGCSIEGFILANKKDHRPHRYKPNPAPVGWMPRHEFASDLIISPLLRKVETIRPEQLKEGPNEIKRSNLTLNIGDMQLNFIPAKSSDDDIILNKEEKIDDSENDLPTREERIWKPDKMLCHRFNIPNPYDSQAILGDNDKNDKNTMNLLDLIGNDDYTNQRPSSLLDLLDNTEDTTVVDPLLQTIERPSIDLFKDIFG